MPENGDTTTLMSNECGPRLPSNATWNPSKHLRFVEPTQHYTLKDLGIDDSTAASPIAISDPFPLFTLEAVQEMRRDILSDTIVENNIFPSALSSCYVREFNGKTAPFTFQAFKSPEVLDAVSKAAGIELVPIMDLEIGHANIQVDTATTLDTTILRKLSPVPASPLSPIREDEMPDNDGCNIVNWHIDAYPWVVIVMLSHTDTMIGGETAIRCGDGSVRKIRGPKIGDAFVFQGLHIQHMACKALNSAERVTMVTSYRAKDPMKPDGSHLTTIRAISKANRLNYQWTTYRLDFLAERFAKFANIIKERKGDKDETDIVTITKDEMTEFTNMQIKYLQMTADEMM